MKPLEPCRIKVGRAVSISMDVLIFLFGEKLLKFADDF
jgi:hypothetical protein